MKVLILHEDEEEREEMRSEIEALNQFSRSEEAFEVRIPAVESWLARREGTEKLHEELVWGPDLIIVICGDVAAFLAAFVRMGIVNRGQCWLVHTPVDMEEGAFDADAFEAIIPDYVFYPTLQQLMRARGVFTGFPYTYVERSPLSDGD